MENKPYLTFSLNGLLYGIDALLVQEIFYLPEITPAVEAPEDIVGLLNLRGKVVPVMHLGLRLGQQTAECHLSDSIVVLAWEGLQIGIIVNAVNEVKNINVTAIEHKVLYGRETNISSRFVAGVAKVNADMIMLLSPEKVMCRADLNDSLLSKEAPENLTEDYTLDCVFPHVNSQKKLNAFSNFYERCCPHATAADKYTFRERAESLRQATESSDFTGLIPLAVIGLNNEYFGMELEVVREFINLHNVTPVPCCPPHVIGNMNLRGEIVTLFDIRSALKMPIPANTTAKAIVIQVDDVVAGLPVDEVFDVMYLRTLDVKPVPAAIHSSSNEFIRGTAAYSEKMLSILDLPKILTGSELIVNEEV